MKLVGIDIGGTFTDLALYDSEDGRTQVHKVHSTPDDPGRALVTGVLELCERAGIEPASLDGVLHGTTVATNAVLEHHGARTGMVTTQGVRDVLHIGRHQRPEPYSVLLDIPWQTAPFVERQWRLTVPERLAPPTGEVIEPLDEEAVREAARELGAAGVEAIAVCFLFSYLDPAHELRAAEILREELPDCFVCTSARHHPAVPRVRALHDGGHERVRRPGDRRVPRAPGGGAAPRRAWPPRSSSCAPTAASPASPRPRSAR